jgi:hypothetical protein
MNGCELLHEAGVLVAAGWCQGVEAETTGGDPVDVQDEAAARWSLLGALQAASFCDDATRIQDVGDAIAAIAELIVDPSLAHWNDVAGRTQDDVSALLAHAELLAAPALGPYN